MSLIWTFITSIPDIIKLLQALQKAIEDAKTDRKVQNDIRSLHEALNAKDASKITALFANTADPK